MPSPPLLVQLTQPPAVHPLHMSLLNQLPSPRFLLMRLSYTAYLDAAESASSTAVDTVNLPLLCSLMSLTWLTHPYVHLSSLE